MFSKSLEKERKQEFVCLERERKQELVLAGERKHDMHTGWFREIETGT